MAIKEALTKLQTQRVIINSSLPYYQWEIIYSVVGNRERWASLNAFIREAAEEKLIKEGLLKPKD